MKPIQGSNRGIVHAAVGFGKFTLTRYEPEPEVGRFVEHYWCVCYDLEDGITHTQTVLSFPNVHLAFEQDVQGRRALVYGIPRRPFVRVLQGSGRVLGVMEGFWGPKGLAWDLDANGKPYLTEYGLQAMTNDDTPVPEEYGGGVWNDGKGNFGKLNNHTLALSLTHPETGEPYDYKLWSSELTRNPDPVKKSWQEHFGVLTDKELFVKNGQVAVSKPYLSIDPPAEEPSDINFKRSNVAKVIKEYSWKMMFAKDEAEFNQLKKEMQEKAKGLGYDDVINWQVEQATRTVFTKYNK